MNTSRRQFLRKAAYVAPVILTVSVAPAFAGNAYGCKPPKNDCRPKNDCGYPSLVQHLHGRGNH